ncbi:hypothetical protein F2P81_007607 [Scophthalmus maximus]|uniref:NOL1/NOP2/NSUN 5/7 ferredoxin-like domain-containing protein n=1 Tax=Scophthalmus maximus TaxID=52904 RepID=A0A6A4TB22_SCOMX|nr:hypothetical protein F2P81_007607 [Scophthalmus maximus]
MVKNRNIRGRSSRSSVCKAKKAASQIASSQDDTPPDDPAGCDVPADHPELRATGQGQLGFPDRVYLVASAVFQNNHLEKPAAHRLVNYGQERGIPLPEVIDEEMRRAAFELAFNTLKYQELLEDIMIDSCFYLSQPIPDDQMGLAAVMLYDFQDRKFLLRERQREEEVMQEVRDVENYLLRFKTKLVASLARCRIKHNLLSIECILPERVKMKQERSSTLPLYTWVNTLKSSPDEVQSVLKSSGFSQVKWIGQLEGQTFCKDPHCGDVLVFPGRLRPRLYSTKLLSDHRLVIQDKSCSLGPNIVCSVLPEEGDVLMVGCFSGLTVSHTASLIAEKHKANSNNQPTVYVCVSDRTVAQREDLQRAVSDMGCKNVEQIPAVFQSLDGADRRLQKVRVILLTPKCSVSAVSNPVEFILQENGDTDLLQDLSQGSIAQGKLEALVAQQKKDIGHALKCGLSPSPFSSLGNAEGPEETDPLFILEPSDQSNGCFLAVLIREPEPVVKQTPQEVLARANAKGLLDKIGSNQPTRNQQHRHKNRMTKAAHARTPQPLHPASVQPRQQESKGINGATLSGRQEFTDRRQSSQGKPKALRLQARKNNVSSPVFTSEQESSCSSSSRPENSAPTKSIPSVFNTTTSSTTTITTITTLHPAPPPAARPRRVHQVVLKPVVFVLPPVHSPNFLPPQNSQAGFNPNFNYNKWRTPPQTLPLSRSSEGLSKETILKSQRLF